MDLVAFNLLVIAVTLIVLTVAVGYHQAWVREQAREAKREAAGPLDK